MGMEIQLFEVGAHRSDAIVERNSQHRFSVNLWCGVIDNQLIGPAVLPSRLKGRSYVDFLQNELPIGGGSFG